MMGVGGECVGDPKLDPEESAGEMYLGLGEFTGDVNIYVVSTTGEARLSCSLDRNGD